MSQTAGTPIRVPASAFLLIDSQDRDQRATAQLATVLPQYWPQPLNNFNVQKRQPFVSGYFHRIGTTEVKFEYNTPNINERNNKIEVAVPAGGAATTITIPPSFYTPTELAGALQTALVAAFPGEAFTVSFEAELSSFRIDNTGGANDFQLLPFEYDTIDRTKRGLYFLMNWGDGVGYWPQSAADDQYGLPEPSMTYTRYIDVCSSKLTQYQLVKDNGTRENTTPAILLRLYIGNYCNEAVGDGDTSAQFDWPGCRPCMIHRLYTTPKYSMWNPGQYIDNIDIELRDDAGELLLVPGDYVQAVDDLGNNVQYHFASNEFQLTVHCSET